MRRIQSSSRTRKQGRNWPGQVVWARLPSNRSCHLPGAQGLHRRYGQALCQGRLAWDPLWLPAWTNRLAGLVDCQPLRAALPAVTPAHCSSSGSSGALAPHPCPQEPPQSLGGFSHAEQVLRLAADTPVSTTESGCSTSTFSVWGTSLQAGTNAAFCEKATVLTKILNSSLPSESFFFFFK